MVLFYGCVGIRKLTTIKTTQNNSKKKKKNCEKVHA